ncbi:MAG TPA: ABC-2 family transporter protein [Acidimicrobiia bacterium]|nr:ABC-2 family transporter protein [Acidimicrobiia bacterium]
MRPIGPARLAAIHLRVAALNEFQYRLNFFVQLLQSIVALAVGLIAIAVVYSHTDSLGGWSQAQLLAVMGVHLLIGGVIRTFVAPNMYRLMEDVAEGTLDYALTRPADSQLMVSVRQFSVWSAIDIIMGVLVVLWSGLAVEGAVGLLGTVTFLFVIACGTVIVYSVWLSATTLTFRIIRGDHVMQLLNGIYEAGRWPVTLYPSWLRLSLTFLVPLAFAVTVPAEVIASRFEGSSLVWTVVITAVFAVGTRILWRRGIRNYSGASA